MAKGGKKSKIVLAFLPSLGQPEQGGHCSAPLGGE